MASCLLEWLRGRFRKRAQSYGFPADPSLPKPDKVVVVRTGQELNVGLAFAWGTFGTVHRVEGTVNGADAVVKLPRVHRLSFHVGDVLLLNEVDDENRVCRREEMLQEEAKVHQSLHDCRGVVPWLCNVRAWIGGVQVRGMALQKMDGTLRQLWTHSNSAQLNVNQNRCNSIRLAGILGSAVNILWALDRMHECGFCHMDITPENLLWSEAHCQLYLADFGSAARRPGFTAQALQDLPETANIRGSYALAFRGVWRVLRQLYDQFHYSSFVRFYLRDETPSDKKVELPLADRRLDYFALVIILRNLLGQKGFVAGRHDSYPEGEARTIPNSFDPPRREEPWGRADPTWPSLLEARVQLRALTDGLEALALQPEHELKQNQGDAFLDDALRRSLQDWQPAESRERLRRLQELDLWRGRLGPGPSGPLVFWHRDSSGTAVDIMSFELGELGDQPQYLVHEAKKELAARLGCLPPQIKLWALLRPRFESLEEEEVFPGMRVEQLDSPSLRVEVMPVEQLEKGIGFEVSEHFMTTSYEEVWYLLNSRHVHPDCISLRDLIDAGSGPCRAALENKADPNQIGDWRWRDPNRAGHYGDGRGTTPLTYAAKKTPYASDNRGWFRHENAKAMEMMQMLLEAGAEVNMVDANGDTPLSLVQCQLEKWCDQPQMYATFRETRSLLCEAGADPTLLTVSV
ncbi:unnamed protein product [Symbiodinium sp. CCMP2456]|nr:unnamed protein product [Symbiodinium sp. CCMP2456]